MWDFRPFFKNFDNCQPEVVSDVISVTADQDVGMDVCVNFGDSRLKPSEASFSVLFRTLITSDPKSDVISGVVVDPTGVKVPLKFGKIWLFYVKLFSRYTTA